MVGNHVMLQFRHFQLISLHGDNSVNYR